MGYDDYAIELVVRKDTRLAENVAFRQEFEWVTTSLSEIPQDVLNNLLRQMLEAKLILPGRFSTFRRFLERRLFTEVELENIQQFNSGGCIMAATCVGHIGRCTQELADVPRIPPG